MSTVLTLQPNSTPQLGINTVVGGSRTVTDGATTNNSTTVTSATANFSSTLDVGAGISGSGIPANATIVSVTNSTTVVISAAATATATGVSLTFSRIASAVLADGSNSSYLQIPSYCRLDSQVTRVGFATPSLPAGAKVLSVGLRRTVQTVVSGSAVPLSYHWFRSTTGTIAVAGQAQEVQKTFFNSPCPTSSGTSTWTTESVGTYTTGPGGQPWDVTTNLNGFTYDLGRGDFSVTSTLNVSEVFLDITYQQQSSVNVTGPTGTISDTQPTIKWSYSSPDSQPQQAYQVAVYTAAQVAAPGFQAFVTTPIQGTAGYVLGEDLQWTVPSDLTNGTYYAYVQAQSRWAGAGSFYTAVASTSWSRNVPVPVSPPPPNTSNPPPAAVLNSATYDSTNNRVALNFQPGTPPTISPVGSVATSGGTGTTTLAVNPTAVGDVLVFGTILTSTSLSVSAVSGGGVTNWTRVVGPFVGSSTTLGLWIGQVTSTGSSTITITGSGSLASTATRLVAQQFTSTAGANSSWALDVAGTGLNNTASSTTVSFPSVTPTGPNRAYIGLGWVSQTGSTSGQTSGYTAQLAGSNLFLYNPSVSTAQSPTAAQSPAGTSTTVGAVLAAGAYAPTTAFTVQASRDGGQSWLQADGSPSIPSLTYLTANGLNALTVYDYVAPLNIASQYRVIAYAGSPLAAATSPSSVLTVTPADNRHWLKNPANPLNNTVLPVAAPKGAGTGIKITKRRMMGMFQLLGGPGSQVLQFPVQGPTYGDEYEIELIFTWTDLSLYWAAVDQLDRTGGTLLWQKPDGTQLWVVTGPGASGQETEETYDAVAGDPTTVLWRRRKLVLTQVDAPDFF